MHLHHIMVLIIVHSDALFGRDQVNLVEAWFVEPRFPRPSMLNEACESILLFTVNITDN